MSLNGIIALILHYFTEFNSFAGQLRHRPQSIVSQLHLAKTDPCSSHFENVCFRVYVNTVSNSVVWQSLAYLTVQKMFGGGHPLLPKILAKTDPPSKKADFFIDICS